MHDPHTYTATRKLKDMEKKFHIRQIVKASTRITNKTKRTIDLIFINIAHIRDSGVLVCVISDHMPVYLIKKRPRV